MPAPKDPERYEEWRRGLSERGTARMNDPEYRQKISNKLKGRKVHNKGVPMSEAQKAKLSAANKGSKVSEETKAKISASTKGKPKPWMRGKPAHNKGVPMSEAQKAKLSAANKGKPRSPEASAKASESNRGRKRAPEVSEKLSNALKGKKRTPEQRARISAAQKGRPGNKEFRHTDESKAKMSAATNAQWERWTEDQRAEKLEILRKSTVDITKSKLEEVIASELEEEGTAYEQQKKIGWYRVDFYLPESNTVIEAQGCYWHGCEQCGYNKDRHIEKRSKDAKRHEYLQKKGYTVRIIWEHERQQELRKLRRGS